jgi:hypothetical protein
VPNFTESNLLFTFPDAWTVRKYDDTVAYQSLSGHGLKGVDFIAFSPDGKIWLMEVKNYRPRLTEGKEYRAKRRNPDDLAEHVVHKFQDTLRLLRIVDASMRKHWYRRIKRWYLDHLATDTASIYWFWSEAKRRSDNPDNMVYLLWMETPEKAADYSERTRQAMVDLLPAEAMVLVVEHERPGDVPITAAAIVV